MAKTRLISPLNSIDYKLKLDSMVDAYNHKEVIMSPSRCHVHQIPEKLFWSSVLEALAVIILAVPGPPNIKMGNGRATE